MKVEVEVGIERLGSGLELKGERNRRAILRKATKKNLARPKNIEKTIARTGLMRV